MTYSTPEITPAETRLNDCLKRISDLLVDLQRLRLERGSMSREALRTREQQLVNQIKETLEEYNGLADQLHLEMD